MAKIAKTLMSGHFVKIFKVQQALLYKVLQLCGPIYRVRMVVAAWNFHTTLGPLQVVDFNFGRWVGEGWSPHPPKTFFPIFVFFATYDQKIAFWRPPKILEPFCDFIANISRQESQTYECPTSITLCSISILTLMIGKLLLLMVQESATHEEAAGQNRHKET